MTHLKVVAGILVFKGKILCLQRGKSKYPYTAFRYEFPGGKIEPGESHTQALERELREELDLQVHIKKEDWFYTAEYSYPDFSITMDTYFCHLQTPDFVLKEHVTAQWLLPEDLTKLDWAPADLLLIQKLAALESLR